MDEFRKGSVFNLASVRVSSLKPPGLARLQPFSLTLDPQDVRNELPRLENRMEANKHEILKWMLGILLAQTALIVAVMAFLR